MSKPLGTKKTERSSHFRRNSSELCNTGFVMKILNAVLLTLAMSGFGLFVVRADSTNLTPSVDTALLETNPDNNLGSTDPILSGTTANGPRSRALFKFDLTR